MLYTNEDLFPVEGFDEDVKAFDTGVKKVPAAGDYYLQGKPPIAYKAYFDFVGEYPIAELVKVEKIECFKVTDKIGRYGEAYELRYDDIGPFDFSTQYIGCWESEEDFIYYYIREQTSIPEHLEDRIDWVSWGNEVMEDFVSYKGCKGVHIFKNVEGHND